MLRERVEALLPPRGQFMDIDGQRIHYVDTGGTKPAIVMIHGLGGNLLHFSYAFIPIGMMLVALSILFPAIVPAAAGIHAIGSGAIGAMTLAVMVRATLGHTGRPLRAGRQTAVTQCLRRPEQAAPRSSDDARRSCDPRRWQREATPRPPERQ